MAAPENALAEAGIRLFPGACGNADAQWEAYLGGSLNYNPDTVCDHHHHHEGECGEHKGEIITVADTVVNKDIAEGA